MVEEEQQTGGETNSQASDAQQLEVTSVPQPEKTPFDLVLDELDALKARVVALESIAHSGHELNEQAVQHIAAVVVNHLSTGIRKRLGLQAG